MKHMRIIFTAMISLLVLVGMSYADTNRLGATSTYQFNKTKRSVKTAAYTATTSDSEIAVNATGGAITVTLPSITDSLTGMRLALKIQKTDSSTNMVTVAAATGETVGGETSRKIINQNDYIVVHAGPVMSGTPNWTVDYESSYLAENHLLGTVALVGGANIYNLFATASTNTTLTSAYCGTTFNAASSATFTLPSTIANCKITFGVFSSPAVLSNIYLLPYKGQGIYGKVSTGIALSGTSSAAVRSSGATQLSDNIQIIGDGVGGWFVIGGQGPWGN
jgi:lipopolysaccharide export LptBFGC system permease protein LptF